MYASTPYKPTAASISPSTPNSVVRVAIMLKKREACYAHQSQEPETFWPYHETMQSFRGLECRVKAAEAFVRYARTGRPSLPLVELC